MENIHARHFGEDHLAHDPNTSRAVGAETVRVGILAKLNNAIEGANVLPPNAGVNRIGMARPQDWRLANSEGEIAKIVHVNTERIDVAMNELAFGTGICRPAIGQHFKDRAFARLVHLFVHGIASFVG